MNNVEIRFAATAKQVPGGSASLIAGNTAVIDSIWSSRYSPGGQTALQSCWWQCDAIIRHINRKVCGNDVSGLSNGMYQLLQRQFGNLLPLARGVSVGCGFGRKEADAIKALLIDSFDLFELSRMAVSRGQELAFAEGLQDRMNFRLGDAFEIVEEEEEIYDAVFWNNSLHHMPDVDAALAWSYRVLRPGGLLILDDYVGPTRMQWSDRLCAINTDYRRSLPKEYLVDPRNPEVRLPIEVCKLDIKSFIEMDPSEAADSERIVPCIRKYFPDATIIPTGGGIYLVGLYDILHNILQAGDYDELKRALQLDDECIRLGESPYAVSIAVKG